MIWSPLLLWPHLTHSALGTPLSLPFLLHNHPLLIIRGGVQTFYLTVE